ncbi:MAG: hypothetical protein AAF629_20055 [Chloroflexota bacterium]
MTITPFTPETQSYHLSLNETLNRLKASDIVAGLAFFGSRTLHPDNPVSDYDLLVLVPEMPYPIFQMLTHIDQRMADVVFVEVETVDKLVTLDHPVIPRSPEGMLMLKIRQAQIVYDASGHLEKAYQATLQRMQSDHCFVSMTDSHLYAAWFWENHGLFHIKRMIQSDDPVYLMAVDMMLIRGLSSICHIYYQIHDLIWEGEKAAIRYLQSEDPAYFELFQACLQEMDRKQKALQYEQLVKETLKPVGSLWQPGITTVYLRDTALQPTHTNEVLQYWEHLLGV